MPITDFLSSTRMIDEFESLSPVQRHLEKTYATGFVAASNSTVTDIAHEVVPPRDKRALNRFLTEYDWDEDQFNYEASNFSKNGETRWSNDGYIIIDDMISEKA